LRWGRRELTIQQVGRDRVIVIAHRRAREALANPGFQAFFLHQTHDARAADPDVLLDQILVHAVKLRRVRFGFLAAIVAIVSAFRNVSTKSDHAPREPEIR
jgi:hypothetical protein